MLKIYLQSAMRNLTKNKAHTFINVAGLSVGMAVAILIGLWIMDELSFDKYHKNYDSIAQVMQHQMINTDYRTQVQVPIPLGEELRTTYGGNFRQIVMSSMTESHVLAAAARKITQTGNYMQAGAPELFSLKIKQGDGAGLKDPSSILLSQSAATALFGNAVAVNQTVRIDNELDLKVAGVYEDLPFNCTLNKLQFIAPWEQMKHLKNNLQNWGNNGWQIYVRLTDKADLNAVSAKIKNAKMDKANNGDQRFNPVIFLHPMSRWHLYSEFKNGVNTGGRIQYLWLFGTIGVLVLLLACINFMNLSTARSERRAKEVGIRKAIGSLRGQLIGQFFAESVLVAAFAFAFALLLVQLALPFFNEVAGKRITVPGNNLFFWLLGIGFTLITGLIAGSYPALYLSSFQPVKVLKGTFRMGAMAAAPRKVLVVTQFAVSVMLIIGTIIVFRQIRFAENRPVGYSRDGLLAIETVTPDVHQHYEAFRDDLIKTGAIVEMAESSSPTTESRNEQSNFDWNGRDKSTNTQAFMTAGISQKFGKTVGWQFIQGRDFSTESTGADHLGFVVNGSAAKLMGFKNPVGETIHWVGYNFTIIGVIKDMVIQSPFDPVVPAIFYLAPWRIGVLNIKINPRVSASYALGKIETAFKKYCPSEPFAYKFADDEYARKFATEERVGQLASFFAVLAIFISCLGLFGMASFMAEQRIKEIGVRKVLGASVFNLWGLLSRDFVVLVIISVLIAAPAAYYFMHNWLQNYQYRTEITWWIFAVAGAGALVVTLATVSFQAIRAALMNPVKSLRTE